MSEERQTPTQSRSIARKLARELRPDELDAIAAGTTSCSDGKADDCDVS